MIEVSLAKKLIEEISAYTDYNVNIMNKNGIIIASCNKDRIGDYHEVAYKVIQTGKEYITADTDSDYPGVQSGINMPIELDGERIGVVGITGKPEEVKPIALIVKLAVESLIKYEGLKMKAFRHKTNKERFLTALLEEQNKDPRLIRKLAEELQYSEDYIRIPVLCRFTEKNHRDAMLEMLKSNPLHKRQDISFAYEDKYILLFKTLPHFEKLGDYKFEIGTYLSSILPYMQEKNIDCCFFVGSVQNNFSLYSHAFAHCKWLENKHDKQHSMFFMDYISEYALELLPAKELYHIYNVYENSMDKANQESFKQTLKALIENDFNIVQAAKASFVHRNTFIYRLDKIKQMFGIQHKQQRDNKWILILMYIYLMLK